MAQLHPDSATIDSLGTRAIMDHFDISRQAVFYWRRSGIPKQHRRSLKLLAEHRGVSAPDQPQQHTPQNAGA